MSITFSGPLAPLFVVSSAGSASLTGTTSETNIAILRVPAGFMGANGIIELKVLWSYTNSINNKSLVLRHSATSGAVTGGTSPANMVATTSASLQSLHIIRNNNAVGTQTMFTAVGTAPFGSSAAGVLAGSINTANDSFLNLNGILASAAETITVVHCYANIFKSP